jgi:putative glutamine amidotransferase
MKPLIGINLWINENRPVQGQLQETYYQAVISSGGVPVLLPPMPDDALDEIFRLLHGVMLSGGPDYDPKLYGQEQHPETRLSAPSRQDFDMRLMKKIMDNPRIPVLGICAGCQLINIGLGGTLIQDIPSSHPNSKVIHSNTSKTDYSRHDVMLKAGSQLSRLYKNATISVPTSHHQAVDQLGRGLQPTAYAEDGIIEALELTGRAWMVAVQWHPERDYEGNRGLFDEFVKHAAATTLSGVRGA